MAIELVDQLAMAADVRLFVVDHATSLQRAWGSRGFELELSNIRTLPVWSVGGDVDQVVFCTGDERTDQAVAAVASLVPGHVITGIVPSGAENPVADHVAGQAIAVHQSIGELVSAMGLTSSRRSSEK